jgi:quercetin dioxygenase-like cupin family protein
MSAKAFACIGVLVRRSRGRRFLGLLCLALTGSAFAQPDIPEGYDEAVDGPIVPVHHEPHHRQLFQQGAVRVIELQIPPGDRSWYHSHEWPILYLTLSRSRTRTVNIDADANAAGRGAPPPGGRGAPARGARPGGRGAPAGPGAPTGPRAFASTGYIENPVIHRVENMGTGLFRAMGVINETMGDESQTSEQAGFQATPDLENAWFRSYRMTLAPGEATPAHRHTTPVVIFQATDGHGRASGPMSWEFNEPGQWAYFPAGTEHSFRNSGDAPLELLEIEVRGAQ